MLADCGWFVVRKEPKDRGTRQQVEGSVLDATSRVLMVEDTITTGGSTLTALGVVRASWAPRWSWSPPWSTGVTPPAASFAAAGVTYAPLLTYHDVGIEPVVPPTP